MGEDEVWVWRQSGEPLRIDSVDDQRWVREGRARGCYAVLSCSDRFNHPPEYYPVFVDREAELGGAMARVRDRGMQEVLAVLLLNQPPALPTGPFAGIRRWVGRAKKR